MAAVWCHGQLRDGGRVCGVQRQGGTGGGGGNVTRIKLPEYLKERDPRSGYIAKVTDPMFGCIARVTSLQDVMVLHTLLNNLKVKEVLHPLTEQQ